MGPTIPTSRKATGALSTTGSGAMLAGPGARAPTHHHAPMNILALALAMLLALAGP